MIQECETGERIRTSPIVELGEVNLGAHVICGHCERYWPEENNRRNTTGTRNPAWDNCREKHKRCRDNVRRSTAPSPAHRSRSGCIDELRGLSNAATNFAPVPQPALRACDWRRSLIGGLFKLRRGESSISFRLRYFMLYFLLSANFCVSYCSRYSLKYSSRLYSYHLCSMICKWIDGCENVWNWMKELFNNVERINEWVINISYLISIISRLFSF